MNVPQCGICVQHVFETLILGVFTKNLVVFVVLLCYNFIKGADEMPRIIPIEGLKTLPQYLKRALNMQN